jgi:hypothetical protein
MQFGAFGRFIGRIDAGEVLQLAGLRLCVKALWITPDAVFDRRVDENLW